MGFNPNPTGPELLEAAKVFLAAVNDSRQTLGYAAKDYERKWFREWQEEWHAAKERLTLAVRASEGLKVACPKCNGGQGWDKTRFTDESGCSLCGGTAEVTEQEARDYIDSNRG